MTLLRYKIEIPEHRKEEWKLKEGETERERRERILKVGQQLSAFDLVADPSPNSLAGSSRSRRTTWMSPSSVGREERIRRVNL